MKALFKKIYSCIPFKLQIFSALKTVWTPTESIYKHLHFKGIFAIQVEHEKFKMKHYGYELENMIFWNGLTKGWEKESINLWIQLCKHSSVIVDVGANTGIYSLIAKTINSNAQVYAFEPVNRVYQKLRENIELNTFDIHAYEVALSNSDGEATIYDTDSEHTYSVTVNQNMYSADTKIVATSILTIKLDTFIKKHNILNIDLIKIDVETHEAEVLEGFLEHIHLFKPSMLVEILTDNVARKIQGLVKDLNYLYFNIDEDGGIRQVTTLEKSDYYNYLFCNEEVAKTLKLI